MTASSAEVSIFSLLWLAAYEGNVISFAAIKCNDCCYGCVVVMFCRVMRMAQASVFNEVKCWNVPQAYIQVDAALCVATFIQSASIKLVFSFLWSSCWFVFHSFRYLLKWILVKVIVIKFCSTVISKISGFSLPFY